ncbi:MAG: hypothetical protein Q8L47_05530 [bacterium]|nr:hypothetical protein [bacterium]
MNDKKSLQLAKQLKLDIQKGFGKLVCKELDLECANCKAQILIGHLNWYINLLDWSINQDKKLAKSKKTKK